MPISFYTCNPHIFFRPQGVPCQIVLFSSITTSKLMKQIMIKKEKYYDRVSKLT